MGHHLSRKPVPFQRLTTLTVKKLFANVLSEALLVQLCAVLSASPYSMCLPALSPVLLASSGHVEVLEHAIFTLWSPELYAIFNVRLH